MHKKNSSIKAMLTCLLAAYLLIANYSTVVYATEGQQEIVETPENTTAETPENATAETPSDSSAQSNATQDEAKPADLAIAVVEVSSYSIESGVIDAGENAEILLNLRNVSSTERAVGVMMTMSSNSGMIYPVAGTDNQVYVGTISAGGKAAVTVPITVNPSFEGEYVDLTCSFSYESNGTELKNSATLILPAASGEELYVQSIGLGSKAIVNSNSLLSISYANKSKKNIEDAVLILDGKVTDDSKQIKLGAVYAGKSYMKDYHITFTEAGQQDINVSLSYTNSSGDAVTTDLGNYSVAVTEATVSENGAGETDTQIVWVGRAIALIALIAAAVAVILYIKRR